jgi:hypothetical protein
MTDHLLMLTLISVIPACLLGAAAVAASVREPTSELSFYLGLGVSLLGTVLAIFWFWFGEAYLFSPYTVAVLSPVVTGTFALGRAVR